MDNRVTPRRPARRALLTLMTLVPLLCALAACSTFPAGIRVGMTRAEVLARFGTPAVDLPETDGERLVYGTAPFGQVAYGVNLQDGVVESVVQVLTQENFATIQVGTWSQQDVLFHFGLPAIRHELNQRLVWDYRYREVGVYNSLFSITFNDAGIVAATENGPDWMFDNGGPNGHHK